MSRSRFLFGLDRTPDDRLTWAPADGVRTPLQTADGVALTLSYISQMLTGAARPGARPDAPPPSANREEAKARLASGFDRVHTALSGLSAADLSRTIIPPWRRETPLADMIAFLPGVIGYYQGQLNYIQLCYGDNDPNIPADWFPAES